MRAMPTVRLAAVLLTAAVVPQPASATVLEALTAELKRSMKVLGEQPAPPYFISYEVTERDSAATTARFGALTYSDRRRQRDLDVDLRVGDYGLDNTRPVQGPSPERLRAAPVPIDDDVDAIRAVVWQQTDRAYKQAARQLTRVRTDVEVKADADDTSDDFSRETPERSVLAAGPLRLDLPAWQEKVKRYTLPFAEHGDIYRSFANFNATVETRWFVNSEGAEIQTAETRFRLAISASTRADDGQLLNRYESFSGYSAAGLPDDDAILATVQRMIDELAALREAPIVEPYTGPAILSGRASGVFFHEVLGHRVEGHRQKHRDDGQTFKKKIGARILPPGFTVLFDPTRRAIEGHDLVGAYAFDNQGVAATPVTIVEDGVFRRFLMSRTPIDGFPRSNGHGRKETGYVPVARQSNLIVQAARPVTSAELKARLLALIAEQDKPFGLLFKEIEGGVTSTGRYLPNAFNVQPVMVYRVYPDGSEELVRGADMIGTPLTTLSRVVAADDTLAVFNGTCGAESGGVPVSAVSPAVLISQVEVQKSAQSQDRPPILPAPLADAAPRPGDVL